MRHVVPRGVTARLIVYLALIGVLPPLVVGVVSYHVSQGIVREEMQRHAAQLLQAQSDYLESQVDQIEGLIGNILGVEAISDTVARRGDVRDTYDQLATQARIGYLLNGYMDVRGLVSIDIFTADGRHYHVGDTLDVRSIDEAQRDALFDAVRRDPDSSLWIGVEPNVNRKSRYARVIATARAINVVGGPDQGARVAGLLLISQDVTYRYDTFRELEGDMPGRLLLVDGANRVIYDRDASRIGALVAPVVRAALADAPGATQRTLEAAQLLVTQVTSPGSGWRLVSLVALQELDARSFPIWRTTTAAILACLMVIALATLSFSRSVVAPLRRIRYAFQELQRGRGAAMRPLPVPGRDEVGELTVWFNTFLDSWGARERSEAALRESELRFRAMHEASLSGLCIHHEGIVLETNQALCREFGREHAELVGARFSSLFVPDTPAETLASVMRGEANAVGVQALRADGSRFPAELSSRRIPYRGHDAQVVDIRNIEAHKQAEEEIERMKNQAEVANHAKSQFLATMSHEIRTPMNAVLGLAFLLQSRPLGPVEHDMVRKIRNAGRSLLGIINNVLDFSKIEAGRLEIEHAAFRLGDVLDNVATIMASSAGAKDIELIVAPAPEAAMHLVGDALRLEQALINLASNAIKFTEVGHVALEIAVEAERAEGLDLRFTVSDTGIGIPAEKQEEIFTAFAQAENSTTRRFGGTGLGLTITRRIVALMGGEVGLVSAEGQGSAFSFTIPVARDAQAAAARPAASPALRALIADEHPGARAALADVARSLGWRAEAAETPRAAAARALAARQAGAPFDVLLLGWRPPGDDMRDAVAALAADGGEAPPAIVMVTGRDRAELIPDAVSGMVGAVISKPVTASAMSNAVDRAQRKRAGQREESVGAPGRLRLAGLGVLVVDDSEINRDVARQILENEGARVLLAADGSQALDILRAPGHGVRIVLMDVQMPVMDGYQATRHIRETLGLADLPVVALTAGVLKDQQAATIQAGMSGFVPKPFDVDMLIGAILRLAGPPQPAPAPPAAPEPMPQPAGLPHIDVARGLRNWKDSAAYARYLRRFAQSHGADAGEVAALLARGERPAALAALHKLKGSAGAMALPQVAAEAERLEQALRRGQDPGTRALQAALDAAAAAAAAANFAGPEREPSALATPVAPPGAARPLDALLQALDLDNPDAAEAVLDRIAGACPPAWVAAVRDRLDGFDFRGAEALTRALAADEPPPPPPRQEAPSA